MVSESGQKQGMRLSRYACVSKVVAMEGGAVLHLGEELVKKLSGGLNLELLLCLKKGKCSPELQLKRQTSAVSEDRLEYSRSQ